MELVSDMKFICEIGKFEKNLQVGIEENSLTLKISKDKLFRTLSKRKEIVGFINKKLDGLVEEFLENNAKTQEDIFEGC